MFQGTPPPTQIPLTSCL